MKAFSVPIRIAAAWFTSNIDWPSSPGENIITVITVFNTIIAPIRTVMISLDACAGPFVGLRASNLERVEWHDVSRPRFL